MNSHTIDLARYSLPTLWVTIDDLRVPVSVPDTATTELLLQQLQRIAQAKDGLTEEEYNLAFDMLAALLSSNHNFRRYTAEELKQKNITVLQIVNILTDWVGFISEYIERKN